MRALVLFSGGQDSTTCLYWAKRHFDAIQALNIIYGQRHVVESKAAQTIANKISIYLHKIDIKDLLNNIADSALLNHSLDISAHHKTSQNLPASFIPGRNILLLTIAASLAFKEGIHNIVTGVCQTDFSGYPDCRDNTIKSLQVTLSLAMDYEFTIHTPLMWLTKAETVKLAQTLPGCFDALAYSHTCYEGQIPPCMICPACKLRKKGFDEAGVKDPLLNRSEKNT